LEFGPAWVGVEEDDCAEAVDGSEGAGAFLTSARESSPSQRQATASPSKHSK